MSLELHTLRPPKGAKKKAMRVGRGSGSGKGKTSGRGHKGQLARSGGKTRPGFEGGQMPLQRRVPKRGFRPIGKKNYLEINIGRLAELPAGQPVTPELLRNCGWLNNKHDGVKLLASGEISSAVQVKVHKASAAAVKKIEAAGGKVELL